MRPTDRIWSTAFRLALGVTLFVLTALVLASTIGCSLLRSQLVAHQDARITEIFTDLQETSQGNDQTDLIDAVTTRIKTSPDRSTVYLLRDAGGAVLAASLPDIWCQPGWSTVEAATLSLPTDYFYCIFAGRVDGYTFVVGLIGVDLDDLAEISRSAFVWSALGVLLAVIGVGALIATRITEVEAVLHRTALGDLNARLTLSRAGSDLDRSSSRGRSEGLPVSARAMALGTLT